MTAAVWLLVLLPSVALGFTLLNLLTWRRGRPGRRLNASYSVLVPARNEEQNIEACVRAASATEATEVIVYDDGSVDRTPAILAKLKRELPKLIVLQGRELPEGWLGQPHACHCLAEAASGSRFLFVDADVRLSSEGIRRIDDLFETLGASVVSAMPRQVMHTLAERLLMPMLHLTYTSWFWLELVHKSNDLRFLAANGQVLAVDRADYESTGGYAHVRDQVVDDMAFCRRVKATGRTVVFADGHEIAACRMYDGYRAIRDGFGKNLYPGIGGRPGALAFVLALYIATFVLPWLALASAWAVAPTLLLPATVAVLANVLTRLGLVLRFGHPIESIVLQPLSAIGFCEIATTSWRRTTRGAVTWRGRLIGAAQPEGPTASSPKESTS